jgi:glutamate dehydrogenase
LLDKHARYLRQLGNSGKLNRKLEFLPFDEDIGERKTHQVGLTAPELAVLLAYGKMELYDAVLGSDVPEDPYIATAINRYFPRPLRERFAESIQRHPLRREIIATHIVNSMVNRVGPSFVFRVREESAAAAPDVVRAYLAAREVFGLVRFWTQVEALDNKVADETQTAMIVAVQPLLFRGTLWFLRHCNYLQDLNETVAHFAAPVAELAADLYRVVSPGYREQLEAETTRLCGLGVPEELAQAAGCLYEMHSALDIAEIAAEVGHPPALAAEAYYALDGLLNVHWLWEQLSALPAETRWQGLARAAMLDDVAAQLRNLTVSAFRIAGAKAGSSELIEAWQAQQSVPLAHWQQLLAEMQAAGSVDNAMLSVALRELQQLAPAPQ